MTRETYIAKKVDLESRMHQTRIDESEKKKALNLEYEDRLQDLLISYRRQRQALMEERDMKRVEIENAYKTKRRELWAEDCDLVTAWRAHLSEITPPTGGGQQHEEGGEA
jgi:hypothetical protein